MSLLQELYDVPIEFEDGTIAEGILESRDDEPANLSAQSQKSTVEIPEN